MIKVTDAQLAALRTLEGVTCYSAFEAKARLSTLYALVGKGLVLNVTGPGPGGLFSPVTHYKFRISPQGLDYLTSMQGRN